MGRFLLDAGGQTLVLATGSGAIFSDVGRSVSVPVGTLVTSGTFYCGDGPIRLVFTQLDGAVIYSGTVNCPSWHDLPEVKVRPSADQAAADLSRPSWDDLRVSLRGASVGAAAPALTTFRQNTGGTSTGVQAYAFSKTLTQSLHFDVQLPHNWVAGTGIRPHVHWPPGASADTGVARWELEYTWANAVNAPANTFPVTVLDTVDQAAAGAYAHQIAGFAEIAGTGKRLSSVLMCRLARVADATEDTFDAVAFGLSVDFHIQVQGHGSDDEYTGA